MAWCAFFVFISGMAFQITRFYFHSRPRPRIRLTPPSGYAKGSDLLSARQRWIARLAAWRVTLMGVNPLMAICTSLFHVCVFILPVFLLQHNSIMGQVWGVTLCPHVLSDRDTDLLCGAVFSCGAVFLMRRLFVGRVRAITTRYDYLMLGIALGPFVTGFLAVHATSDYKTLVMCHILSAQILLVVAPFTKFIHMVMFFINRILLAGELSFGPGRRTWT
jgi:nitrate reductase gamma subunit